MLLYLFLLPRAALTLPTKNIFYAKANLVFATFSGKYSALLFFRASHTLDNHQDRPYKRHIHSKTVGYSTLIILFRRTSLENSAFLSELTGVKFSCVCLFRRKIDSSVYSPLLPLLTSIPVIQKNCWNLETHHKQEAFKD